MSSLDKAFMAKVSMPLYLEEETKDKLKKFAKSQKRTMSASIEILINEAYKKAEKQGVI
tara:strand:+ start:96 stop:272 length:177 start_codon:yes stop_codon:yes gene_type:complete